MKEIPLQLVPTTVRNILLKSCKNQLTFQNQSSFKTKMYLFKWWFGQLFLGRCSFNCHTWDKTTIELSWEPDLNHTRALDFIYTRTNMKEDNETEDIVHDKMRIYWTTMYFIIRETKILCVLRYVHKIISFQYQSLRRI